MKTLTEVLVRSRQFEKVAHTILGRHESSRSRVVLLEETYGRLSGLSIKQDELFRQALRCVENQLFRASHVMAWAGFMDFLEEKISSDGFIQLKSIRPHWKFKSLEDIRDQYTDFAIVEAARDVGLCGKSEMKALHGLLNKRNECAHPTDYFPGLNETLGYVSELLKRIEVIQSKKVQSTTDNRI